MKKIFSTIISTILLFCVIIGSVGFFQADLTIDDMRKILIEKFVPESYLDGLPDERVESLYYDLRDEVTGFGGTNISTLNETKDEPSIETKGSIPSDDMTFSVTKVFVYNNSSTKHIKEIQIFVEYDWIHIPIWLKTDAVTVNWDSNVFTFKSGSFYSYSNNTGTYLSQFYETNFELDNPTILEQGGLGYDTELAYLLAHGQQPKPQNCFGRASFVLLPRVNPMYEKSTGNFLTTSINAQYRHNRNPFVGSVGFSIKGVSVNFDLSFLTDTTTQSTNIFYSN